MDEKRNRAIEVIVVANGYLVHTNTMTMGAKIKESETFVFNSMASLYVWMLKSMEKPTQAIDESRTAVD